jgi:acyl-CoA synthetase (AMP-forming)/AMP-acid ligase II
MRWVDPPLPDESAGVRILAYLSSRMAERPSIVEMKMFCGRHLPAYMSPDTLVFMNALPRTSTNKVDYQSLTELARSSGSSTIQPVSREHSHA